jgi:DNA-binding LacI/PurR family transcriptional regulator
MMKIKKTVDGSQQKIYKLVSAYLMEQIESGKLKLGDAIYSEHTLCKMFNVSRTSIRRAIREMVENNILESQQGSGTFVKGKIPPKNIALINHYNRMMRANPLDTHFKDIVFDIEAEITRRNCRCLMFSGIINNASSIGSKTSFLNADGIIIDGNYQDTLNEIDAFKQYFPACTLIEGFSKETSIPTVNPDFKPSFIELLNNEKKRERILFLTENRIASRRWTRLCFEEAVSELNMQEQVDVCSYTDEIPEPGLDYLNPDALIAPILERSILERNCRSIMCSSDRIAMYVIQILRRKNYRIPEDVTVSGCLGLQLSNMTDPPLTSIKTSVRLLAEAAVKMTLNQIYKKEIPAQMLVPAGVFYRESMPRI